MEGYIQQRSARAALISSGIVATVTALFTKGLNQPLKVSIPLGVAAAVGLDYWNNVRETKESLREGQNEFVKIARDILDSYEREDLKSKVGQDERDTIRNQYMSEREKIKTEPAPEPGYINEALTNG